MQGLIVVEPNYEISAASIGAADKLMSKIYQKETYSVENSVI